MSNNYSNDNLSGMYLASIGLVQKSELIVDILNETEILYIVSNCDKNG